MSAASHRVRASPAVDRLTARPLSARRVPVCFSAVTSPPPPPSAPDPGPAPLRDAAAADPRAADAAASLSAAAHDAARDARLGAEHDVEWRSLSAAPGRARRAGPRGGGVVRRGVRCGLFAAAATAGAIVGFALRAGDGATAPFAVSGRMLLGVPAGDGVTMQWVAVAAGVLLHCAIVVAWAVLFAAIAPRRRGAPLFAAAALLAAAAYFASTRLLPTLLRLGHGVRAFPPQVALLYAVLAIALGVGMRLAFSSNASPPAASL